MSIRVKQMMACILAASAAVVGGWATVSPMSFYKNFPWPGRHWVSEAGAYDEHLVRDVGGLYLALLVVTVWALFKASDELLRVTGGAWTVFSVPHLLFHLDHLDGLTTFDKVSQIGSLGVTLLLALALLLAPSRARLRRR
ncbi:MAG: hypothetical protein JO246_04365 [Frankiaceae bacterium]|nr:hypothetical protein [Frankiaceae bacterium]MBV9872259.1 hypothetical protein [Frankiaceae bacterium]